MKGNRSKLLSAAFVPSQKSKAIVVDSHVSYHISWLFRVTDSQPEVDHSHRGAQKNICLDTNQDCTCRSHL